MLAAGKVLPLRGGREGLAHPTPVRARMFTRFIRGNPYLRSNLENLDLIVALVSDSCLLTGPTRAAGSLRRMREPR